ncbi:MAG: hypothetical protein K9W43_05495 [Candidatus Thorarchaeota archaeon]|nr:hypothetical protein [Candidatus Thorarchaeota archaeon]
MTHKKFAKELKALGLDQDSKQWNRYITIIKIMLSMRDSTIKPLRFGEIYEELKTQHIDPVPGRVGLHRDLRELVRLGIVKVEDPSASRRKYIIDVHTIVDALENIQYQILESLEQKQAAIAEKIKKIKNVDCSQLAETIVFSISGKQDSITTRFAKGIEGMHRLLLNNITRPAGKGDIIRTTAMYVTTLVSGGFERTRKFIDAAMNGAEVRYIITSDFLELLDEREGILDESAMLQFFQMIHRINQESPGKFLLAVTNGPRTYNHVSLNDQRVALILTENPVVTTLFTREFNADLIDSINQVFDRTWKKAIPFELLTSATATKIGLKPDNPIVRAIARIHKKGGK